MSYQTQFSGAVTAMPAFTPSQVAYLTAFASTRRYCRDETGVAALPDPLREAVGLPVGKNGCHFVAGTGYFGQDRDATVVDQPSGMPGAWCNWEPSEDGSAIRWNGNSNFNSPVEWMRFVIEHFCKPWGVVLEGEIAMVGEDEYDRATIVVRNNVVIERQVDPSGNVSFVVPPGHYSETLDWFGEDLQCVDVPFQGRLVTRLVDKRHAKRVAILLRIMDMNEATLIEETWALEPVVIKPAAENNGRDEFELYFWRRAVIASEWALRGKSGVFHAELEKATKKAMLAEAA